MRKPYIIGIGGGSGSGKTLFLSRLRHSFSEAELCVLSQDEYYKEKKFQHKDENGIENFDLPTAIDVDLLANHVHQLISGSTVRKLEYTFNNPALVPKMLEFKPAPVLIVEGIFIFHYPEIVKLLDFSIFIHTRKNLKLDRRIKRDAEERGYDLEHVMYTQDNHVQPSYKQYIKPHRHLSDIVVPNNEKGFGNALMLVELLIKSKQ